MLYSFSGAAMALVLSVSTTAAAQSAQKPVPVPGSSVVVTAQKEPADPSTLPVSVTTITEDLLKAAGITWISEAGILSPNTNFTEFSARKLSNPRVRGIGASPANPGVMTYVDGVPQFSSNSSSFDLIDVGQVEFVRGPQSALFGRNALGGLINISSGRPSLSKWTGNVALPFGSDAQFDVRANVSGPIKTNTLAAGFTMAYSQRDRLVEAVAVAGVGEIHGGRPTGEPSLRPVVGAQRVGVGLAGASVASGGEHHGALDPRAGITTSGPSISLASGVLRARHRLRTAAVPDPCDR